MKVEVYKIDAASAASQNLKPESIGEVVQWLDDSAIVVKADGFITKEPIHKLKESRPKLNKKT